VHAIARGILSVRPSVCPSVTFRYCVQTNEDTIVRFSASGRTMPLVSLVSAISVSIHLFVTLVIHAQMVQNTEMSFVPSVRAISDALFLSSS